MRRIMLNWLFESLFGPNPDPDQKGQIPKGQHEPEATRKVPPQVTLEQQGQDQSEATRKVALQKLVDLATPEGVETLCKIATNPNKVYGLEKEVAAAISTIENPEVLPAYIALVNEFLAKPTYSLENIAEEAVQKIGKWGEGKPAASELLLRIIADFQAKQESLKEKVALSAIQAIAKMPGQQETGRTVLASLVDDYLAKPEYAKEKVAKLAVRSFVDLGARESIDVFLDILAKPNQLHAAARSGLAAAVQKLLDLRKIDTDSPSADWSAALEKLDRNLAAAVLPPLIQIISLHRESDDRELQCILPMLAALGQRMATPLLVGALHFNRHNAERLQIYAARALGELRDPRAIDALIDATDYEHHSVRFAATNALALIADIPEAGKLPTPQSWMSAELNQWRETGAQQLRDANAALLPQYRKTNFSSGDCFSKSGPNLTPNQALFLAAACQALDRMRTLQLEETPINRQVKSTLEHIQHGRNAAGERDWVCTTRDLPSFNSDFLADLEARIKWGEGPIEPQKKQRTLLATAEDQLLTTLRNMNIFKKVGDKGQYAGFLVEPHLRDVKIAWKLPAEK